MTGQKTNYKIILHNNAFIEKAINYLNEVEFGEEIRILEVIIRDHELRRTDRQRMTLWGWYYKNLAQELNEAGYEIDDDNGTVWPYDKDLLHCIFREKFLCYGEIKRKGKIRKLIWSSNDLPRKRSNRPDKPTFSEYINSIREFSSQHWGIELLDPPPTDEYEQLMNH